MATRNFSDLQGSLVRNLVIVQGQWFPQGDGAVVNSSNKGHGFTVARTVDTPAKQTATFTANPTTADGVAITVGATTVTSGTDFTLGATLPLTLAAIVAAYNTAADPQVTAAVSGVTKVVFTARDTVGGTEGNSINSTETTDTDGVWSFGASHLAGGVDMDGIFTITLNDRYVSLVGSRFTVRDNTNQDLLCQLGAADVASAGTIVINLLAGGTKTDMDANAGNSIEFSLLLQNGNS